MKIAILGIYRPPTSEINPNLITSFMDKFCDLISEMMPKYKNIICMGDFNIHVNNLNDLDAQQFVALTEALGLSQHVNFTTQNQGYSGSDERQSQ